ncbi:MAG: hypothetical protein IKN17_00340 [Ruminococcus sp.]|nr:hypothetical protein [Ruminococcus sp.]
MTKDLCSAKTVCYPAYQTVTLVKTFPAKTSDSYGFSVAGTEVIVPEWSAVNCAFICDANGSAAKSAAIRPGDIEDVKVGDVDGDGKINLRDYALLQKYLLSGVSEFITA